VVAQHADLPALEAIEEVTPRHCGRAAANSSGRDASQVQSSGHFLCMLHGVSKEKNGALGAFPYVLDYALIALLVPGEPPVDAFEQVLKLETLPWVRQSGQPLRLFLLSRQ
jgi:hypothetical protein